MEKMKRMTTAITRMSDRAETCELREKENVKPTNQGASVVTSSLEPKSPIGTTLAPRTCTTSPCLVRVKRCNNLGFETEVRSPGSFENVP